MKKYYLYYLIDPNTNEVRYIGITCNPKRRLSEHKRTAKRLKSHKDNWIMKLINNGQLPLIKIIHERDTWKEIIELEISEIDGHLNLTNSTTGGDYFQMTDDVKNRLSILNKGKNNPCFGRIWSKEERDGLSAMRKGRTLNDNWKEKIGLGCTNRKKIIIEGIEYPSIKEAQRVLKCSYGKIRRLAGETYEN